MAALGAPVVPVTVNIVEGLFVSLLTGCELQIQNITARNKALGLL